MKVFFDNCTSPTLSDTIGGFVRHLGHEAHHITSLPCGPHATDLEWMSYLRESRDSWIVITGDGRIQKNKAERAAYRDAGLKGFVLAPAYQKRPVHQIASILIWRWPELESLLGLVRAPALYEVPINKNTQVRQLPI